MVEMLLKLGLSEKEAKVYLAALTLGSAPAAKIAQQAGVNRPVTYVILEKLAQMKLVTYYDKGKIQTYTAESPERLSLILQEQEREIKRTYAELEEKLPELQSLFTQHEGVRLRLYESSDEAYHYLLSQPVHEKLIVVAPDFPRELTNRFRKQAIEPITVNGEAVIVCAAQSALLMMHDTVHNRGVVVESEAIVTTVRNMLLSLSKNK